LARNFNAFYEKSTFFLFAHQQKSDKELTPKGPTAHREKKWKIGMMERWKIGQPIVLTTIPLFHCSNINGFVKSPDLSS